MIHCNFSCSMEGVPSTPIQRPGNGTLTKMPICNIINQTKTGKEALFMTTVQIPAFGETEFFDNQMNKTARVVLIPNSPDCRFSEYCRLLNQAGFHQTELISLTHRRFAAFQKGSTGVFVNFFAGAAELQIVVEEDCTYFSYTDNCQPEVVQPQLTQVKPKYYGLSDVVRLSDGRQIVIDIGDAQEENADALFARLKADSPYEKPIVAAWIMTHAHCDHFHGFFPFIDKYGDAVVIEKFFFNFPDPNDLEHYPALSSLRKSINKWYNTEGVQDGEVIKMFMERVEAMGVPVYMPHTGQNYRIGDANVWFLASTDDTVHCSLNINHTCLMFMMELGGQRIFFTADGSFSDARLPERYGNELKADIMQVPHHGFGCGDDDVQIQGFRLVAPRTCLLPVEFPIAYTSFTTYRPGTNYLMTRLNIDELLTGEKEHVLPLPYSPNPAEAFTYRQRYLEGRDNSGARTWIFNDLNTSRKEDFIFSVFNGTYYNAQLQVELFFENMQKKKVTIQNQCLRLGVFRLNCLLHPEEDQSQFDEPDFLEKLDIPENTYFTVRFISNLPIVVSHRDHSPAYRSTVV